MPRMRNPLPAGQKLQPLSTKLPEDLLRQIDKIADKRQWKHGKVLREAAKIGVPALLKERV